MDNKNNSTVKTALGLWGRLLLGGIMCFIVYASLIMLGNAIFAAEVGYQVIEVTPTEINYSESTVISEYRYAPGENPETHVKPSLEENQRILIMREMTPGTSKALLIFTQIILLVLICVFPYGVLWELGDKDNNRVQINETVYDRWRGLKVGLLAVIPTFALYALVVLCRLSVLPVGLANYYRFLSAPYVPFVNWMFPVSEQLMAIPLHRILLLGLTVLPIPLVSCVSYQMGYHRFSIAEHVVFKKKK